MIMLSNLRHSCAHLLAAAVLELWPEAKPTIGPAIEDGFYYDFDFGKTKISESDLPQIEAKMAELAKNWKGFEEEEISPQKAKTLFKDNEYKLELIAELEQRGEVITIYRSGDFFDLCHGGHVKNPASNLKHFKLLSLAGAYWRGSEKNKMLTRIYGTIFPSKEELDAYLERQAEAKKRDHKKIGRELGLFMFHETAPGMAYWLPKGVILYNELVNFWRTEHQKEDYQEIFSPLINKKELYETSGHWNHYKENMFLSETEEGEIYALKPMNCPNAMVVFGSETRSYRNLPLRLSDTDALHRFEKSGTLNGLLRIREFRQDDAHIFVAEEQIADEYEKLFGLTDKFYSIFNLNYRFRLGTKPDNFMGETKLWERAENELKKVLGRSGKEYFVLEGDGAFYGPKIDILMKDALGREWQMGTLQLDFQQPLRFGLKYSDKDGSLKTPIVIHRVIYGSLERFIGILVEHYAGAFPVWLSPVQIKVLPISEKYLKHGQKLKQRFLEEDIRAELDSRDETLGAKIRDAQKEKVPYMVIIGEKEVKENNLSIRNRKKDNLNMDLDKFIAIIKSEIEKRQ